MILSFKVSFKLVCFVLAIYMTADLIERYVENNDASVISYKQFNENKGDMYPTFTFCTANNPNIMYNNALNELHLSRKEYGNFLKGLNADSSEKQKMWGRIITIDPERFINSLQLYIVKVDFHTKGENGSLSYRTASNSIDELKIEFVISD